MTIPTRRQILVALVCIDLALVLLHVVSATMIEGFSWTVARWFDLDSEANIPTWFSSAQLLLIALTAFAIYFRRDRGPLRRAFLIIALAFLFLSIDETASIHEGMTLVFRSAGIDSSKPYVPGVWTLIYPVVGLIALVVFRREAVSFLADSPGRATFLYGGAIFIAGSLGLEVAAYFIVPATGADSMYAFAQICLEEGFEMLGVSLMAYAMLLKLDVPMTSSPRRLVNLRQAYPGSVSQ